MVQALQDVHIPSVRRLLLIKPSSLGDIVHALPTFEALRRRFPAAECSWMVKAEWADILRRVDGLDRIWPVEPSLADWMTQIGRLRAYAFDLVVDLQGLFRSGAAAWLSGCGVRVGFANAREGSPLCYTHRILVPTAEMHAVDRYLLVARALGCSVSRPVFPLTPLAEDRRIVHTFLAEAGVPENGQWVAMQVSARWPTKRWPIASFVAVARALVQERIPVILVGSRGDQAEANRVAEASGAVSLAGRTSLSLLPALLQASACLVTNDSGPMHVAAAMSTPVVALFGPTSAVRTGPYGVGHRPVSLSLPCQPCYSRSCRNPVAMECLIGISPERVVREVRECVGVSATAKSV